MITEADIKQAIKAETVLWYRDSRAYMKPLKLGRYQGVPVVIGQDRKGHSRVLDVAFVCKQFHKSCMNL